jgi:hypothetical protein
VSQAGNVRGGGGPIPPIVIQGYKAITFADSPYTVQPTDYYISADTSGGAITVNFPDAPTENTSYIIKDRTGDASINNITVKSLSGVTTVDEAASKPIAGNYGAMQLLYHSGNYEIF